MWRGSSRSIFVTQLRVIIAQFKAFARLSFESARLITETQHWLDDPLFLQAAYRAYLKREPDQDGYHYYLEALQRGSIDRWGILRSIVRSSEFKQVCGLPVHPLDALHQPRMMLVRSCLPPARVIVDLGGAAIGHPEGALLAMGYPHRPREIFIVDLPPSQRQGSVKSAEQTQIFVTADGVRVHYLYQSMSDPLPIMDESVDLVFAGESIEHITEQEVDAVCQSVYRILRPTGYFCLDTPNAALARLQSPSALLHPEHKKEYYVRELRAKLERWDFKVVEAKGICPMPRSLQSGVFDYKEMVHNIGLSENPEEGYLFYLKAVKSQRGWRHNCATRAQTA